jgi:hypothetical protein
MGGVRIRVCVSVVCKVSARIFACSIEFESGFLIGCWGLSHILGIILRDYEVRLVSVELARLEKK